MGILGVFVVGVIIGAIGVSIVYYKNGMLNIGR